VTTPNGCAQCGAADSGGQTCRSRLDTLLSIELEFPPAFGAVHHLTVACYSLQHPAGYVGAALAMWRQMLAQSLDGLATTKGLLREARRRFEGPARVREKNAVPPPWWPTTWPLTTADALPRVGEPATAQGHIDRVRRWAASIRATLDAADPQSTFHTPGT
jgi:Family of unknown function (DUF5946)